MIVVLTKKEEDLIRLVRCLKPYGKIEVAMSQDGREVSVTKHDLERFSFKVEGVDN